MVCFRMNTEKWSSSLLYKLGLGVSSLVFIIIICYYLPGNDSRPRKTLEKIILQMQSVEMSSGCGWEILPMHHSNSSSFAVLQPWWSKFVSKTSFLLSLTSTGRVPNTQAQCPRCEFWSICGKFRGPDSCSPPLFSSQKNGTIGADLPANGQIQVPIKHCICARNINIWTAIIVVRRRVCSHFPSPHCSWQLSTWAAVMDSDCTRVSF